MKIREHRRILKDSMDTVLEIDNSLDSIVDVINKSLSPYNIIVTPDMVNIEKYCYDYRIDWDTHLITIKGYGVFGMTDGNITR